MEEQAIINTFNKGINQDVDFILQPDGTYRNMKNGMLISMDGHHFTVELSKGNKSIKTLTPRYSDDVTTYDIAPMPIGFISFIDKLVVFSTNNESTGGYGEIGVMTFKKIQDDFTATYTPYYHHPSLNFSKYHKIEGFSFRENDTAERVYFTDNNNEPRVFDIANPIFTNYIGASDIDITSTIPKQYMVLEGVIEYPVGSGVYYGPTDGSGIIVGNIFTSDNTNNTYTQITVSAKVIEYYPLELLDWTPSRNMGNIKFKEYGTGSKYCGSSIYFYRLYSTDAKISTTWSYPSTPIHVGMDNITSVLTGVPYIDFVGNGSDTTLAASTKSVIVTISDVDTNFDVIELCCAEYDQVNDVPYIIKIVNRKNITSSVIDIEDTGSTNLGEVSINDLTLFPANILKVKTLTSDKNYNLIANITEREEFDLDLSGVSIGQFEYPLICYEDYKNTGSCSNGFIPEDASPIVGSNPAPGTVRPYSRWVVTNGDLTTNTVLYYDFSGTPKYFVTGDVIVGVPNFPTVPNTTTIFFTGSGAVRPCTTRNKYDSISSGNRVEDYIEFTQQQSAFWDYKNPAVASHNKGYWSNEKYRFGILFFDLKGNPFYVKHLGDYTFNDVETKGGLVLESLYNNAVTTYSYSLNVSGALISGLDIPESVMNECSGFSIVRAERDPTIITQGILLQTLYAGTQLFPMGVTPTDWNSEPPYYDVRGCLVSFICPDDLVNYNFSNSIGVIGQKIQGAFWVKGDSVKSYGANNALVTRMFEMPPLIDPATSRVKQLQSMNGNGNRRFNEYNGDSNIIGNGRDFFNRIQTVDGAVLDSYADNNCATGTFGTIDVMSVGCKKMVIFPENFNHYGGVGDYNGFTPAEVGIYDKIVVNMLTGKDPSSQYGGSGPSAIADTLYISTGHFQTINSTVKADTLNGTFPNGENKYTFNNIEIFGGDCFTNLTDVVYGLYDSDYASAPTAAMCYQIWFPCECNVNWGLNRGLKGSNKGAYPFSTPPTGVVWNDPGMNPTTQLEGFSYNKSYSTDGTAIKYPALPFNYEFTGKFEYRTRFAGVKYPGEAVDSFRKFLTADYKDLDGKLGEINNIRSKDGRVLVWQNHGVSSVPILERQLLAATSGAATTIGTGGVVDRFDPINSYFGNQHQHGLTSTEYGYIWFDMRNRALCIMSVTGNVQEISLAKGLQAYFNNQFNEGDDTALTASNIYNTNNYQIPEVPLLGYGIIGVYDPRYKMSYLTFKYADDKLIDLEEEIISITAKDFTIGYSHVLDAIVGFYDFTPGIWHNHNDLVLSANNSKNYVYYGAGMPETTFNIGDVVKTTSYVSNEVQGEYVCISPVTITSYLSDPSLEPGYSPSTYWVKINSENEIYLQTFNTDYCKFYGKVYDHDIEVVVNPKSDQAFSVLRIQQKSNDNNYTSVYFSTDNQNAQDVNIPSNSKAYRYIDKSYYSSAPLPRTGGRLTDHYVKIKFVLKNYLTNPTVAKNKNKIFQFLKTWFITRD